MSRNCLHLTGRAKSRRKTGTNVEINIWRYDLAKVLAEMGVGRDEWPDQSLLSARIYMVGEIDAETRVPLDLTLVRGASKPPMDQMVYSVS